MEVKELSKILRDFFGYKAKRIYVDSEKKEVTCTLYDSFIFKCDVGDRYGRFSGGIYVSENFVITDFLVKDSR